MDWKGRNKQVIVKTAWYERVKFHGDTSVCLIDLGLKV